MITMAVDYQGPRSLQTYKFKDVDEKFLSKLEEIKATYTEIDGVEIFTEKEQIARSTSAQLAVRTALIWTKRQGKATR